MHIVPGIDDGAVNMQMSLEMLELAYNQGARHIFCTSHNGYCEEDTYRYLAQLKMLQVCASSRFPEVELHSGCELLCSDTYIEDILYGLKKGVFLPLGKSKCVLTELYTDVMEQEAINIVDALVADGWTPILAHFERYPNLFNGDIINSLIAKGCMIQINAFSLQNEKDEGCRNRARKLLANKQAHFIGSDAHRIEHRPPCISKGIQYLIDNVDSEYAKEICSGNSEKYLLGY